VTVRNLSFSYFGRRGFGKQTLQPTCQNQLLLTWLHKARRGNCTVKTKLLVVSHACVTPINQSFYVSVEEATGWEVELVVPLVWATEYEEKVPYKRWHNFKGKIHPIPVWNGGHIPLHIYKNTFVRLLKSAKPTAIYMHHEPYGLATLQVYLANRLATNVPIGFYAAQNIAKVYPPPFRWSEHYVFRGSSFAFPVTQGALDVLRAKGYVGKADILPLPLDLEVYRSRPKWAAAKRSELGIGPDEFVVGYLGRLVEEKGLRSLLLATAMLRAANPKPWRCVLVGSGPYETELRAVAADLGINERVIFVGFVPHEEAPGWFSLFDLFVLPSETRPKWKEQFGRVVVEANACGTAVIGTDSGEIANVVKSTGGGLIVPEGDSATLSQTILALMGDPIHMQELARQGIRSAREQYDQRCLAQRFAAGIESIL